MDKDTNQPHLLRLVDEDLPTQYFIAIEQVIHVEISSIDKGIFLLISLHYVYDIQYHHRLRDFYLFLEDKLLRIATPSCKKSANYLSVSSAIECYITEAGNWNLYLTPHYFFFCTHFFVSLPYTILYIYFFFVYIY